MKFDKTAIYMCSDHLHPVGKRIFPFYMIFPLIKINFEDTVFYVPNKLQEYLNFYYGPSYICYPNDVNLQQHNYMFDTEDYKAIDFLYKTKIERKET